MKKKILITGINGFLGSTIAKQLKYNYDIVGLVNNKNNLFRIHQENFKIYSSQEDELESVFEEVFFAVIHTATKYEVSNDIKFFLRSNIELPVALMEYCNKTKVNLFFNTDTFFNNPEYTSYSYLSSYTLSKKQTLEWLRLISKTATCKIVNMKLFHMYGNGDSPRKFFHSTISKLKNNEKFIDMTDGNQIRDFIYVEDVVSAYEFLLESYEELKTFQEFEVGTGINNSIKEVSNLIKKITNSKTELRFGVLNYRDGEIMKAEMSNRSLLDMGWRPKFSLEQGLLLMCK